MFHILNPLYLFGLFLASIPLILHLIGRRRIRERPFSSLFLLKEIKKSSSVWIRIKDLILLLLRICFLLFIVIAFSHPIILSPVPYLGKEAPKDIAILIDISMSMGTEGVFEKAKNEVKRIFTTSGKGNRVTLIAFSDRIEEENEIADYSELSSFLNQLRLTYRATDIQPPLEAAEKKLLKKDGFTKEIFIVSDFQKSAIKNIESVFNNIQKHKINIYISCIEGSKKNLYFSNWRIEPPFPLPGLRLKIYTEMELYENSNNLIELFMDGVMKGVKKSSKEKREIFFDIESGESGYKTGFFRTSGDSLKLDNNFYFTFHIPKNLNVLLVGMQDEFGYLSTALSPGIETPIKLTIIKPSELSKTNPSQYDLLILYNTKIDTYIKARTLDFLAKGGGVLCVMGNEFSGEENKTILEGIQIVKKNHTKKGFFTIKTVDTGFKPLSDFKNKGLKNLYDTKFYQYFSIKSNLKTVIESKSGDPLMLEGNINGGKIVLIPFAFDSEWTQLPLKAIFVPLIYRLTFYLSAKREKNPEYKIGDPIRISIEKEGKSPFFILPDEGKKSAILSATRNEYILRDSNLPGIYKFIPQPGETIPVAVNVKTEESSLDKISFEELKLILPDIRKSEQVKEISTSRKRWIDLFPIFIILSLLFLTAELILQNK